MLHPLTPSQFKELKRDLNLVFHSKSDDEDEDVEPSVWGEGTAAGKEKGKEKEEEKREPVTIEHFTFPPPFSKRRAREAQELHEKMAKSGLPTDTGFIQRNIEKSSREHIDNARRRGSLLKSGLLSGSSSTNLKSKAKTVFAIMSLQKVNSFFFRFSFFVDCREERGLDLLYAAMGCVGVR